MKKFLLAGIASTALLGGSASAADLRARPAAPAPMFTWTGCYGGVNAGYAWKNTHYDIGFNDGTAPGFFEPFFAAGAIPSHYDIHPEGALGGLQAGCNYQFGQFVIGIEGDFDWGNVEGHQTINTAATAAGFLPAFSTASEDLRELGTVRGRIGYAIDRLLLFATAGGAWGRTRYNYSFTDTVLLHTVSATSTRPGWTAGGGGEYAFSDYWTFKLEVLYFRLDGTSLIAPGQNILTPPGATLLVFPARDSGWTLRLGVNYRFGVFGQGVVASY